MDHEQKTRDLELDRATKAVEDISSMSDKLLYHQQQRMVDVVIRSALRRLQLKQSQQTDNEDLNFSSTTTAALDQQQWDKYSLVYETFASVENWSMARASCSFGPDSGAALGWIYHEFAKCHAILHATYYAHPSNNHNSSRSIVSIDEKSGEWCYDKDKEQQLEADLKQLKDEVQALIQSMLEDLHKFNVGILRINRRSVGS